MFKIRLFDGEDDSGLLDEELDEFGCACLPHRTCGTCEQRSLRRMHNATIRAVLAKGASGNPREDA